MSALFTMAFSGAELDHCDTERTAEHLRKAAAEPDARALVFGRYGPAVDQQGQPLSVHPLSPELGELGTDLIFLGRELDTRRPWFAVRADLGLPPERYPDLRMAAGAMEPRALALVGRARSLLHWHRYSGYCANCGGPTTIRKGGAVRHCGACEREIYPSVTPVAIMLVEHTAENGENRLLLGRQAGWPPGSFSALAGFVSPGENLEECCRREVLEEVGVRVRNIRYLMSQSWPFPHQLMLGLACQAEGRELVVDTDELETAQWFTRAEVEAVWSKTGEAFVRPPRFTIAHQLIRAWLKG